MKRYILFVLLGWMMMSAWALPNKPSLGNARIIVLANNLENFYYNYDESSRPSYNTDAGREAKANKIVQMMLASGADIFAFCEVEAKPITLQYLA